MMKSKEQIENDLNMNPHDERYTFYSHIKGKSDVWANFELIMFEEKTQDFARCITCKSILKYNPKTGTASLLRHKCNVTVKMEPENLFNLDRYIMKPDVILLTAKEEIIKKQLYFIIKDLRPLNVTEGEGFLQLAQELVNLGADYGRQNIKDFLTSQTELTRTYLPLEYYEKKCKLQTVLRNNEVSFTTDLWTDEYTKRTFLTVSSHLLNDSMELKNYVLGTRECIDKENGTDIRSLTLDILKEYLQKITDTDQSLSAEDKLLKGVIVTNNDTNIILAFREYTRLSCACHNLNLVMHDVLEGKDTLPELKAIINSSKNLVAYFKQSELDDNLSKMLEQNISTRWNSIYNILTSIQDVYGEIQSLLCTKNELFRLDDLNLTTLKSLTDFLNLFRECSLNLSSLFYPTLNRYVLWEQKLLKHCNLQPDDSDLIKELKKQTAAALKKQFQPERLHYIALFLDPNFKSLKFLSDEVKRKIKSSVQTMLISISDEEPKVVDESKITGIRAVKRVKLEEGFASTSTLFDEFQDTTLEDEGDNIEGEIEMYARRKVEPHTNLLEFWNNCNDLPRLKKLARRILNVPASSTTNERIFSTYGRILEERRTRLLSDNFDKLIFLHSNAHL